VTKARHTIGKKGEDIALWHLKGMGYKIIARNYKSKFGEIDIIAKDRDTLAFVEVKTRKTDEFGGPKMAVTERKRRQISKVASEYLKRSGLSHVKARFDVVAIKLEQGRNNIEVVKDAFESP